MLDALTLQRLGWIHYYRYFVDKGISPLGEETSAFFSRLTNLVVICLQRRANSDISPVHKLPVYETAMEESRRPEPFGLISILKFHDCVELFLDLACDKFGISANKTLLGFPDFFGGLKVEDYLICCS